MENLINQVPLINQLIMRNLDSKSLVNFKETSRKINQVVNKEKYYWIRMMNKHCKNFKEFQESWIKVISKTSVENVKELALDVDLLFKNASYYV